MFHSTRWLAAGVLAVCAAGAAGPRAFAKARSVGFTRAVFRMEDGVAWGRISGGANCDVDYERLQWGREGSNIRTERLGAIFSQAMASYGGASADDNLFENAPTDTDLQVAAAISEMRANICEQSGLYGARGSLSMTVQWQVYDPAQHQLVGKFETHATGQAGENLRRGVEDLFFAAFRANARDLMSDGGFQRLLKAPAASLPKADAAKLSFTPGPTAHGLAQAAQGVVLVQTNEGHGSGFLVGREGYVLTNSHVVGASRTVRVRWADGTDAPGEVVRVDRRRDIALIKTDAAQRAALGLRPALPAQGDSVFAVGAPLDPSLQGTLTRGIVSANRVIGDLPFIQSDVAVTHGNSGGPLLNERGEVVGVTVAGFEPNGAPLSLNLFIPISDALRALSLEPLATSPDRMPLRADRTPPGPKPKPVGARR